MTWRAEWQRQVEHAIADHREHGKTPRHEPQTTGEWRELYERFPNSPLSAIWYVLTGRVRATMPPAQS